jgi:hypothetical protein
MQPETDPPDPTEVATRLATNWAALRPLANREVEIPGVTVDRMELSFGANTGFPPIVQQALLDATPNDGPALEVRKLAEVVNGTLVRLVDDGSTLPRRGVIHLVVNVITARDDVTEARTYEIAALPAESDDSGTPEATPEEGLGLEFDDADAGLAP